MGRTGRGRGLGKILGFNSTIVRGFGFFFTIGAGLVLRIFFLCVLLAVPPNNAIRVFWLRFLEAGRIYSRSSRAHSCGDVARWFSFHGCLIAS